MLAFTHTHTQRDYQHSFVHWTDEETDSWTAVRGNAWGKSNTRCTEFQWRPFKGATEELVALSLIQPSCEVHIFPISRAIYHLEGGHITLLINLEEETLNCVVKTGNMSTRYWPPTGKTRAAAGKYDLIIGLPNCRTAIVHWKWSPFFFKAHFTSLSKSSLVWPLFVSEQHKRVNTKTHLVP